MRFVPALLLYLPLGFITSAVPFSVHSPLLCSLFYSPFLFPSVCSLLPVFSSSVWCLASVRFVDESSTLKNAGVETTGRHLFPRLFTHNWVQGRARDPFHRRHLSEAGNFSGKDAFSFRLAFFSSFFLVYALRLFYLCVVFTFLPQVFPVSFCLG